MPKRNGKGEKGRRGRRGKVWEKKYRNSLAFWSVLSYSFTFLSFILLTCFSFFFPLQANNFQAVTHFASFWQLLPLAKVTAFLPCKKESSSTKCSKKKEACPSTPSKSSVMTKNWCDHVTHAWLKNGSEKMGANEKKEKKERVQAKCRAKFLHIR